MVSCPGTACSSTVRTEPTLTETVLAPPGPWLPCAEAAETVAATVTASSATAPTTTAGERHGWRRAPGSAAAGPGSTDGERGVMSVACPFGRKPCGCPPSLAYTAITCRAASSRTSAALANRRRRLDGDRWLVFHCRPCPAARPGPASPPWSPGGGHQNLCGAPRRAAGREWVAAAQPERRPRRALAVPLRRGSGQHRAVPLPGCDREPR